MSSTFGDGFMGGGGSSYDLSGGDAAPSGAHSGIGGYSSGFDSSGWTVATGSAKATATNAKNDPAAAVVQAVPWTVIAAALVVAVAVYKLA